MTDSAPIVGTPHRVPIGNREAARAVCARPCPCDCHEYSDFLGRKQRQCGARPTPSGGTAPTPQET